MAPDGDLAGGRRSLPWSGSSRQPQSAHEVDGDRTRRAISSDYSVVAGYLSFPVFRFPFYALGVRLRFYGTKGYVEERSRAHSGHSAFTIEAEGFLLLCDFGQNRKGLLKKIRPDAIFISHAHPDHAWGLEEEAGVPVHASATTHEITKELPIRERVTLELKITQTQPPRLAVA